MAGPESSTTRGACVPTPWRELLAAWLVALAVACLWTWPLAGSIGGALPLDPSVASPEDSALWSSLADLWWTAEALSQGSHPLDGRASFWPHGQDRLWASHGLVPNALAAPLAVWLGATSAYGVALLAWISLSGALAYLAARSLAGGRLSSALVGIGWALSPFVLVESTRGLDHVAHPFLPLALLAWTGACTRRGGVRSLLLLGLWLGLSLGVSWSSGIACVVAFFAMFAVGVAPRSVLLGAQAPFLVSCGLLIGTAPILVHARSDREAPGGDAPVQLAADAVPDVADGSAVSWSELLSPSPLHPLRPSRELVAAGVRDDWTLEDWLRPPSSAALSWTASVLALYAALGSARARRLLLAALSLVVLLLATGPHAASLGPFQPRDLVVPLHLATFLAASLGLERLGRRGAGGALLAGVAPVLVALEWLAVPYPLFANGEQRVAELAARVPGDGCWISFPLTPGPDRAWGRQTVHGRPAWCPAPQSGVLDAWTELGLRSPALLRFSRRISAPPREAGRAARAAAEELAAELELAEVDLVFLDLARCSDDVRALDVLDELAGFERGPGDADVAWWYRTRGLFRLEGS